MSRILSHSINSFDVLTINPVEGPYHMRFTLSWECFEAKDDKRCGVGSYLLSMSCRWELQLVKDDQMLQARQIGLFVR